ncbi:hypothetical protein FRC01_007976 [Tulasnella sp. 417]|nr:hypothetical protein FRC01_007976 [Tulasnella sp. 417]
MQATREFLHWVAACAMMANGEVAWDPTRIPRWLADAGFDNIQPEVREIPVGPWMGSQAMQELGGLVQRMCIDFVAAMRPALLSLPGAEPTQVDDLVADATNELGSEENTGWSVPVHIVTAFKG